MVEDRRGEDRPGGNADREEHDQLGEVGEMLAAAHRADPERHQQPRDDRENEAGKQHAHVVR